MADMDVTELLKAGVLAARQGKRAEANQLLQQVVERDPSNEMGWMWLASLAETPADRADRLRRVLAINPANTRAAQELDRLQKAAGGALQVPGTPQTSASRPSPQVQPFTMPRSTPFTPTAVDAAPKSGGQPAADPVSEPAGKVPSTPSPPTPPFILTPEEPPSARSSAPVPAFTGGDDGLKRPRRRMTPLNSPLQAALLVIALVLVLSAVALAIAPNRAPENSATTIAPSASPRAIAAADIQRTADAATQRPRATIVTIIPSLIAVSMPTWTPLPSLTPLPSHTPTATALPTDQLSIVFAGEGRERTYIGLYEINAAQRVEKLVTTAPEPAFDPAVSPDGTKLAYITEVAGVEQLAVANRDGSGAQVMSSFTGKAARTPCWSPDGRQIVLTSDQSGVDELYIVNLDGTGTNQITQTKVNNRDPAWSPDGKTIAFASDYSGRGLYQIFALDLATNALTQLTESQNSSYRPSYSPDGTQIVFVSTRGRHADIYTMTASGDNEQILTFDDGESENRDPSFSADSRWIVYSSNRSGGVFNIFIMRADGSQVQQITNLSSVSVGPRFIPTRP